MPKVLYVTEGTGIGGAERRLLHFAQWLPQRGIDTVFYCFGEEGPLTERLKEAGGRVYCYSQKSKFDYPLIFIDLLKIFRKEKPDIVHTQLRYAGFLGNLAARVRRHSKIVTTRAYSLWDNRMGAKHSSLDRFSFKLADVIVAVCSKARNLTVEVEKIPSEKVVVIANGVDTNRFSPPSLKTIEENKKRYSVNGYVVVGTVGAFEERKGIRSVIEAASIVIQRCPRVRFIFVGEGPQKKFIEDYITSNNLSTYIHILGYQKDVSSVLSIFDIFILASGASEGMSNSILEAMASGKPVIATAAGGNPEVVVSGSTGILIPQPNPSLMAESILRLIDNREERVQMGAQGRILAEKRFSLDKMIDGYEALYRRILGIEAPKKSDR